MPQGPLSSVVAQSPSKKGVPLGTDGSGNLRVTTGGTKSLLNVSGAAVLVQAGATRLAKISVTVAGSAAGSANDAATVGAAATANQVMAIPNTIGVYTADWPCLLGLVITPGTGQTIAVNFV